MIDPDVSIILRLARQVANGDHEVIKCLRDDPQGVVADLNGSPAARRAVEAALPNWLDNEPLPALSWWRGRGEPPRA